MQKYLNHTFKTIRKNAIVVSYQYPLRSFDSFLKLEEEIDLKSKNQKISAFFYRKF
jgi:hypothetical protein